MNFFLISGVEEYNHKVSLNDINRALGEILGVDADEVFTQFGTTQVQWPYNMIFTPSPYPKVRLVVIAMVELTPEKKSAIKDLIKSIGFTVQGIPAEYGEFIFLTARPGIEILS